MCTVYGSSYSFSLDGGVTQVGFLFDASSSSRRRRGNPSLTTGWHRCCCCCRCSRCYCHTTQDDDYKAAGATIVDKATCFQADIVLKVKPPSLKEADMLKERAR